MRKIFLFSVGVITLTFDEFAKNLQQALDAVQEEQQKINERLSKQDA